MYPHTTARRRTGFIVYNVGRTACSVDNYAKTLPPKFDYPCCRRINRSPILFVTILCILWLRCLLPIHCISLHLHPNAHAGISNILGPVRGDSHWNPSVFCCELIPLDPIAATTGIPSSPSPKGHASDIKGHDRFKEEISFTPPGAPYW